MTEVYSNSSSEMTTKTKLLKTTSGKKNKGYTLVEVLFVTAITTLVMSMVVFSLVSTQRLLEATLVEAHLSLQSRALREKLFYHVNEEGGLMNANKTELIIKNKNTGNGASRGWGNGIEFKPHKGQKNRIMLGDDKKLKADKQSEKWLASGTMILQSNDVFYNATSNKTIQVNLDLVLPIGDRRYHQKHRIKTQIINE